MITDQSYTSGPSSSFGEYEALLEQKKQLQLEVAALSIQKGEIVADIQTAALSEVMNVLAKFGIVDGKPANISYLMVKEFHQAFGHPVGEEPTRVSNDRVTQRLKWIQSEVDETSEAVQNNDFIEVLDGLGDTLYFIEGTFVEAGINSVDVIDLIHKSNMTKLWANDDAYIDNHLATLGLGRGDVHIKDIGGGKAVVYRLPDMKIMKGPDFVKPDLRSLMPQGHG